MSRIQLKIVEEANVIDDHLLDIIGNEFKFDHEKGLAEWLKNSVDAYITSNVPDAEQNVIIRMKDGDHEDASFELIDFVGMDESHIDKAFKRWGDPEAAKRGLKKRVYGGHGNGGKFYMRQMFTGSHFSTYKNGHLSMFGFNENKKYGFVDGYKNKKAKPEEALKLSGIDDIYFPDDIKKQILNGKRGFTVVVGSGPEGMKNKIKYQKLIGKFRNHPQSRRILSRINVWINHNNEDYSPLKPDELKPLSGFENPQIFEIPNKLKYIEDGEDVVAEMVNESYPSPGQLTIRSSDEPLAKGGPLGDLNRIDIVGEIGVIASYQLSELGISTFPQASFLYGECICPILEDPHMDSVKNDRTKLVENIRSKALLDWIRFKVDEVAQKIASKEKADQEKNRIEVSAAFNDYLNKWKDKFMSKIMGDILNPNGGGGNGGDGGGHSKRTLEAPKDGLEFSYSFAEIEKGELERITLKSLTPKIVPVGSIIEIESTNNNIVLSEKELKIKNDDIKLTELGESVGVINVEVVGQELGAEGKLIAKVGKLKAEIEVKVIEASSEGKSKKPKAPRVLLSGRDQDPLGISPDGIVYLNDRYPLIYQRFQDVSEGIYWINTQSPMAKAILEKHSDHDPRWRDYLFQRYIDIFVKQIIHETEKRDPESFKADTLSNRLDTKIMQIHSAAVNELGRFFFDESFIPNSDSK